MSNHRVARPQGRLQASCPSLPRQPSYGISRQQLHALRSAATATVGSSPRATFPPTPCPTRATRLTSARDSGRSPSGRISTARGLDAGPVTIAWHLERERLRSRRPRPSARILHAAGLVVPEPLKRPRSSWIRFEGDGAQRVLAVRLHPLARSPDGSGVEIVAGVDDHSRYLLASTASRRVAGDDVVATFTPRRRARLAPPPRSPTTAPSTRHASRRPQRPRAPARVPRHPPEERLAGPSPDPGQLIERFHQTLKRWLARSQRTHDPALQAQLDAFRGLQRAAPAPGRSAAHPGRGVPVDPQGASVGRRRRGHFRLTTRRQQGRHDPPAGRRLHHLKVGRRSPIGGCLAIVDEPDVTSSPLDTGEILSTHRIEPARATGATPTRPRPLAGPRPTDA